MIEKLEDYRESVSHDGTLSISVGKSVSDTSWKNKTIEWSALLKRLSKTTKTPETHAEFLKLTKAEQDRIKDIGGFVGGKLKHGRRKLANVISRQLVTLDADYAVPDMIEGLDVTIGGAYAVYSTHKHSPEKPRLRIIIPLDREVSPDECEAISRRIAWKIGIDYFDDTTYEGNRLMFWPSTPVDIDYVFDYNDEEWVQADDILSEYDDWTDTSFWPESNRAKEKRKKTAEKQGDPTKKKALIGAFCRTYDIKEAIDTFLSDVYIPCSDPNRYTYAEGSTSAGLVLYDDRFAYSNHATDPAGGNLCNAFDLVRIHKFGYLDEEAAPGTQTNRLPSFKAMQDFCREDPATKKTILRDRQAEYAESFDEEYADEDDDWITKLEFQKNGSISKSLNNCRIIIQYDPALKGIRFNSMAGALECTGSVPWPKESPKWRDADDAQLEVYLAEKYCEFAKGHILSALTKIADDRAFHPVREYLAGLPEWDGVKRVDTLLIEYLGAEDNNYVRAVTRKTLCAAYRRILQPGIKFDNMLVENGPQGIGKSTIISKLGMSWYTDSLSITDMHDKTAAEKLQGSWFVEIGEMAGMRKADVDKVKQFLSSTNDKYRASYGRLASEHPRQCVLIGTTNSEDGYLRDTTGNRRYWNVRVTGNGNKKPWDLDQETVDQIWAEVKILAEAGEKLFLPPELEALAQEEQLNALEKDPREGLVDEYLEMLLPDEWDEMDPKAREEYFKFKDRVDEDVTRPKGKHVRTEVSNIEIWVECFGMPKEKLTTRDSYAIAAILERLKTWRRGKKTKRIRYYGRQRVWKKVVQAPK